MNAINTIEELEAVPEDHRVLVTIASARTVWQRTPKGFTRDGVEVKPLYFEGYLTKGRVQKYEDRAPTPGDWITTGRYHYYVVSVEGDRAWVARCYRQQFREFRYHTLVDLTPTVDGAIDFMDPARLPDTIKPLMPVLEQVRAERASLTEAQKRVAELEDMRAQREAEAAVPARVEVLLTLEGTEDTWRVVDTLVKGRDKDKDSEQPAVEPF